MRTLPLLFGLLVATSCRAAVVYDFTPVTQQINALLARENLNGASLLVIRDGSVIDEEYFGTYTAATRIPIASASKWLSALAIERLVERGTMSWGDTVGKYIPTAPADKLNITLGQLFSHTAGFRNADAPCLGDHANDTLESCATQILDLTLVYPPGTGFIYTGNAMQVGGRMAEIATGKSWDQIFQDEVTTPLGMGHTDFDTTALQPPYIAVDNPYVAGGVRSTLRDYANVVQMVLQQGLWNGTQYLTAASLADMQHDQTQGATIYYTPDPLPYYGYGYGEWRDSIDAQGNAVQVSSTGKFGTSPWIDHATGIAAVFLIFSYQDRIPCDIHRLWMNVGNVVGSDAMFADSFDCVALGDD